MSSAQTVASGTQVSVAPANTCYIATINTVSFSPAGVETVNLTAGATAATALNTTSASIPTTVSNVAPWVFRTSIPLTISNQSTEALEGVNNASSSYCTLSAGSKIITEYTIEFRGSRLGAAYCANASPGNSWFMRSRYVERFDSPFPFVIDSPNHMNAGAVTMTGGGPTYTGGASGVATNGYQNYELDPWMPTVAATARLSPDIYGVCTGSNPYGDQSMSPWGGACASHYGQNGANIIDDPILSQLRLR